MGPFRGMPKWRRSAANQPEGTRVLGLWAGKVKRVRGARQGQVAEAQSGSFQVTKKAVQCGEKLVIVIDETIRAHLGGGHVRVAEGDGDGADIGILRRINIKRAVTDHHGVGMVLL